MRLLKRVDRLVAGSVLSSIVLAWLVLLAIDLLGAFAREADDLGKGNYTMMTVAGYLCLTIPRRAYDLFGMAGVIGGLMGLGALAPTAEITAMRAGGMSKLRICFAAMIGVGALAIGVAALGETLAPWSDQRAQSLQAGAKSRDLIASGKTGLWAREGEVLINAKRGEVTATGVALYDVRIYEFTRDGQLARVSLAEKATHDGQNWHLSKIVAQTFGARSVKTEELDTRVWKSSLDPRVLELSVLRPEMLALRDLGSSIEYMRRNQLDASAFESAYWRRVFYPLGSIMLVFASLPFAFGALRSGGFAKRLFLGIVVAIGWYFLQRAFTNMADVYRMDFRLVNLLPIMLLGAGAAWYFRRAA